MVRAIIARDRRDSCAGDPRRSRGLQPHLLDLQREVFSGIPGTVGLRRMVSRKVERPEDHSQVGALTHAAVDAYPRSQPIHPRQKARRSVGRTALPQPLYQHAGVSHFRSPRAYGHRGGAVLPARVMDVCPCLARTKPQKRPPISVEPGGRAVIEIHRRTFVLCVFGVCVKSALSSGPRPAGKQRRGEALAASTVAGNASRHFVRGPACLRVLPGLFLASAY